MELKFATALVALVLTTAPALAQTYDVVIHGGRIVDGAGTPWYHGDVGIKDGKIIAIGRLNPPARPSTPPARW